MEINKERVNRLKEYIKRLNSGENGLDLYNEYKKELSSVNANEAFQIFSELNEEGEKADEILTYLGKVINVFNEGLEKKEYKRPENDQFIKDMEAENEALNKKLMKIRGFLLDKDMTFYEKKIKVQEITDELLEFDDHYLKKENILFPMMEKKDKRYVASSIMWTLHDQIREKLKRLKEDIRKDDYIKEDFNKDMGEIFFNMGGLIYKEEEILFPAAACILSEEDWISIYEQSMEYNFPFIDKEKEEIKEKSLEFTEGIIKTETGDLSFNEVVMIFNTLPVDMTYVDENNKVRFFSKPEDRIFPRSKAVIGREVKNCHPPKSVNVVEEIVDSFRQGKEDSASFWINVKEKRVLIQYFALRDEKGEYKGVLEVSQDITEIKELKGERRVLDWKKDED